MNNGVNWEVEAKEISYKLVALQQTLQQVQDQYDSIVQLIISKSPDKIDSLEQLQGFIRSLNAPEKYEEQAKEDGDDSGSKEKPNVPKPKTVSKRK